MKALIIVDVQNDFCPGGSLAVEDGDRIIPNINKLSTSGKFDVVVATQDWHPENHISFASRHNLAPFSTNDGEIVWPNHCVMGSIGADLRPSLDIKPISLILRKGMNIDVDSYSAFIENDKMTNTLLWHLLPRFNEVYVVGIATDVCVYNTAMDAIRDNAEVYVVEDACAGVTSEGTHKALDHMKTSGIKIVTTKEVLA